MPNDLGAQRLAVRVQELGTELLRGESEAILALCADSARGAESLRDSVSTRLMEAFRLRQGRGAFGLLYELNSQHLLIQVASRLRRYGSKADPRDVLQE
ncbi:MAG: hypothetical protein ACKO32_10155, partial [Planctomycetia bacterium]